ncbi:hypothetical protein [Brevibacillus brevis]|uniref:hypothetical protein n=1 Tax=Brevibacillus brevis TaxID=1393 RepID=UPI003D1DC7A5
MNETQALVQQFTEKTMAEAIFKLRDITWFKAQGHDRLRQQFTHSHILLVVTGDAGACDWRTRSTNCGRTRFTYVLPCLRWHRPRFG